MMAIHYSSIGNALNVTVHHLENFLKYSYLLHTKNTLMHPFQVVLREEKTQVE